MQCYQKWSDSTNVIILEADILKYIPEHVPSFA